MSTSLIAYVAAIFFWNCNLILIKLKGNQLNFLT